jgi:RNA polymerase sigma-70 factor (ECF subfamily)
VVLAAGGGDEARAHAALARLCQTYWYPLYAFVRRRGYGPEDAQDLTQGFFAHLLERHGLARANPGRGRFRSFLLASLRHFLANERERATARKRGGGRTLVPWDAASAETRYGLEPADPVTPETVFERNWALALLEQVLKRLEKEQAAAGKAVQFNHLRDFLMGDLEAPSYAELASVLGTGADALRATVHRLRLRFRALLREEVAHTLHTPVEVEEEIRHLFAVLSRG